MFELLTTAMRMCNGVSIFRRPIISPTFLCRLQTTDDSLNSIDIDQDEINDEKNDEKRLKLLKMEYEVFKQSGHFVPMNIEEERWPEIMEMVTRSKRLSFYKYLTTIERSQQRKMELKEFKAAEGAIRRRELDQEKLSRRPGQACFENSDGSLVYGLGKNAIFAYFREPDMNRFYYSRLALAHQFGQDIIVDCGYEEYMNKREQVNCVEQIRDMYGFNKAHVDPFRFNFCNFKRNSFFGEAMERNLPNVYDEDCFINIHEENYLDLFPKEKLVYLTPHTNAVLTEFNRDDIYIIGGFVDKSVMLPISLAKAKKEGLRMGKLPLDHHLDWSLGNKNLTLDQVMKILLDVREKGDWTHAFRHVPKRKLKTREESEAIARRRAGKIFDVDGAISRDKWVRRPLSRSILQDIDDDVKKDIKL